MLPVISASKRTDIPAFYLRWLIERLDDGHVDVPNPYYRNHPNPPVRRVSLKPEEVGWLVFWSKNYAAFLRRPERFDAYRLYFQLTLNPANEWLEPGVPGETAALAQFERLARRYGGERIAWRYDPLVFWREGGIERSNCDPRFFARVCKELAQMGIRRCFLSIVDPYRRYRQRVSALYPRVQLVEPDPDVVTAVGHELLDVARAHGMDLLSCSEPSLDAAGIPRGACVDGALLNRLALDCGFEGLNGDADAARVSLAAASDRLMPGRAACACTRMIDIGSYTQQCGYACLYCYANPRDR